MSTSDLAGRNGKGFLAVGLLITVGAIAWSLSTFPSSASAHEGVVAGEAASDPWYVKFDGVDGSSTTEGYEGWSDVVGVGLGAEELRAGDTGVARVGGKMHLEDVTLGIITDKAMPKLLEAATKGKVFSKVEIHGTATYGDAGEQVYLAVELENVQISRYRFEGTLDLRQVQDVHLNFETLRMIFMDRDPSGNVMGQTEFETGRRAGTR